MPSTCTEDQVTCVEEVLQRVASDLSMIADKDIVIENVETERVAKRPAAEGAIHISFRLGFRVGADVLHGCFVVPLTSAITLACSLMMMQRDVIEEYRGRTELDGPSKDAMLEVGNFVCGGADAAMRALGREDVQVCFEGCQGVRPDVRPALIYEEGDPLVVGRASMVLGDFAAEPVTLILPEYLFS